MEIPPKLDRRDSQTSLALSQMIMGAWVPQAIYTAVSLGVFESLHEGPRSRAEIANRIAVPQETTSRLLRALCCLELCRESESGLFALTRRGRLLCADTAGSMRSLALLRGRQSTWSLWGRLSEVVRTGKTAPELVAGKSLWEWLADDPAGFSVFNQAMTELSVAQAQVVADAYDFSDANVIVDVAGGYGALLVAILIAYSDLRGIVLRSADMPRGLRTVDSAVQARGTLPVRRRRFLPIATRGGRCVPTQERDPQLGRGAGHDHPAYLPLRHEHRVAPAADRAGRA